MKRWNIIVICLLMICILFNHTGLTERVCAKSSTTYWLTGENWSGETPKAKVMKVTYKGMKLYVDGHVNKSKSENGKGRVRKYHKKSFQIAKDCRYGSDDTGVDDYSLEKFSDHIKKYGSSGKVTGYITIKIVNNKVRLITFRS